MPTIEHMIDDFSGGVVTASRKKDKRFARAVKHFDILSSQDKLAPLRNLATDTFNSNLSTNANASRLVKFLTYGTSQANTVQFALGTGIGAGPATDNTPRLYYRDTIPKGQWSGDSGTTGVLNENLFVQYKTKVYAAIGTTGIISWTLDITAPLGGSTVNNLDHALTISNVFQGLVHSKDDILYIPYLDASGNAFLASNNNGSWSDTALTIRYANVGKIDIAEYGDYIAIGTKPVILGSRSYVFIWNRDSSLATTSEKIDWGTEDLELIESVGGVLIGISVVGNNAITFSGTGKVLFKYWDGGSGAKLLMELNCDDRTITIGQKQRYKNRLYFMMSCKINGAWHEGVWSFGKNKYGEWALVCEYQLNNDTPITSVVLKGFQILGDYLTVAYSNNGTYTLKLTDDQNYTDTSIYETVISSSGDASILKDLKGITVLTEPLPAAGSYNLKYQLDSDTSWSSAILTESTDNSISFSVIPHIPQYKELRIRLESTGGATITGISLQQELKKRNVYTFLTQFIKNLF